MLDRNPFREEEEEEVLLAQASESSSLSWSTRIKGFAICFVIGVILSILGSFFLLLPGGKNLFAVFYTFGNITSIASTCFLKGPLQQVKDMFSPTRVVATVGVLLLMALTLCSALWWRNPALAIIFCFLQYLAMTWYSLSYIPFARDAVKKCCQFCIS